MDRVKNKKAFLTEYLTEMGLRVILCLIIFLILFKFDIYLGVLIIKKKAY